MTSQQNLGGKSALVTGGSRGIGAAIARTLAAEATPDQGERAERIKATVPLGRFGRPEEVGELVAFLASPAAAYITGAHIQIDGGLLA